LANFALTWTIVTTAASTPNEPKSAKISSHAHKNQWLTRERIKQLISGIGMRPRVRRSAANVPTQAPVLDLCFSPDTKLLFKAAWSESAEIIFSCEQHRKSVPTGQTEVVTDSSAPSLTM